MTKRIAVIFDEDIYNQRGMFNAIRNRIKHLKDIASFSIDVFVIGCYEPWHIRMLRHTPKVHRVKSIILDGIKYNTLWYNFTLVDYFLEVKLHKKPIFVSFFYRRLVKQIKGYDLISAHSTNCGQLALRISDKENIPFCVTWHGNDIHTTPFRNREKFMIVHDILEAATYNFFVSDNLKSIAHTITSEMRCAVLYNGRNQSFTRYSEDKRISLRDSFGVPDNTKVVAFVGNLLEVKNPQLLAPIFVSVQNKYPCSLVYWVIGSGKMYDCVEKSCKDAGVNCKFWGNQPADDMPDFMNSIDVLVLPSRNEGLPLVAVEAIACGANVVGSDVGGISEAIGKDNVFPHGDDFIDRISDRIVQMLTTHIEQPLSEEFEWANTAKKELDIYNRLLCPIN